MYETSWKSKDIKTDELKPFGLLWKVYDLVVGKGWNWYVPSLEPLPLSPCSGWILGGISGNDYLVEPFGIILLGLIS